jgi:D-glycero-alpha-D-manno-heptose-7-phosphate kinase
MVISKTPLRFSLVGGGSDLPAYWQNYGPCKFISMAITPSMYVTFMSREFYPGCSHGYSSWFRISYTDIEEVGHIKEIEHDLVRATLLLAAEWSHRVRDLLCIPFEITTIGSIPGRGSGLGTSSALVVGLLKALYPDLPRLEMICLSVTVEIELLERKIGWQDQIASVFGGLRKYEIQADSHIYQQELHQGHWLAERLIAFRLPGNKTAHERNAKANSIHSSMDSEMASRSSYLHKTVELVDPMADALRKEGLDEVARLLQEAWYLKTMSHGVKDTVVDRWCRMGKNVGAKAWKVSGSMSDRSGHLFFLCDPDAIPSVREKVGAELPELRFDYQDSGSASWEI